MNKEFIHFLKNKNKKHFDLLSFFFFLKNIKWFCWLVLFCLF